MIQRADTPSADDRRDEIEDAAVERALYDAAREAIQRHQRAGNSIVLWRNDQIVEVPAVEVNLDE